MKQIKLNKVQYNDSFISENGDLLPNWLIYFYNTIKDGVKKEDRITYPDFWFLFDKNGNFILCYSEEAGYIWLNGRKTFLFFYSEFGFNYIKTKALLKPVFKKYFKLKAVEAILFFSANSFEDHFRNI